MPAASAEASRAIDARPDERVARALQALGVAVQRHRIYPARSPLCAEAVAECRAALDQLWDQRREVPGATAEETELTVRVSPRRLYSDVDPLPETGPLVELAERLFRADVEEIVLRPDLTASDLLRFCRNVAGWDRRRDRELRLSEILTELDVGGIRARDAERLEVLDFDIVSSERLDGLRAERRQRVREDGQGVDAELHKAWARVDVDASVQPIDMVDLAYLVDDDTDLARMLYQLADGEEGSVEGGATAALRETVTQLVHLYAGLAPEVAERRFRGLAASLMELEPEARRILTRDVILPDALETGKSAALLRMLPDAEIVEAITTLADLEIGGQGLVRLALERLDLPPERLELVLEPLLARAREEHGGDADARAEVTLDSDGDTFRDMRAFASHELSVDEAARATLERLRDEVAEIDDDAERLRCATALVPHLRNPDRAAEILRPLPGRIAGLMASDPQLAARQIRSLVRTADRLEGLDPELADTVGDVLRAVLTRDYIGERARSWVEAGAPGEDDAVPLLEAFGDVAGEAFVESLEAEDRRTVRHAIVEYMCGHAAVFAPLLEHRVRDHRWTVVRNVVRVLGFAGPGYEPALAEALDHPDKRVVREVLIALCRIGSPRAAEEIFSQLATDDVRRELAEDAMRRFPLDQGVRLTQRLLSKPEFYLDRPHVARTLVSHFLARDGRSSRSYLEPLLAFRFRFWKPSLMRLGWTAAAALRVRG